MKVYIFLAAGFEEIEAVAPIDIFRRAGLKVTTVSITVNKLVTGAHSIAVLADSIFSEQVFEENCFLFLPGGLIGTTNLDNHEGLKKLIRQQSDKSGLLAAICAAPSVFGKMGLLHGKEAICYPGFENTLKDAQLSEKTMVKAGNIFTAKAAGSAIEFALLIVSELTGKENANKIRSAMFI